MSVCKHVLVAFALITACGHLQASGPVPTAEAATAMVYGIEMPDAAVAELAEVAPVEASVLLAARAQPTLQRSGARRGGEEGSSKCSARWEPDTEKQTIERHN